MSPPDVTGTQASPAVPFAQALRYWFKLGCISFGGPAGQIALMHEELVTRRRWISEARFQHALSYCMLLPGPEAQQLATYIGWLMHGARGGIAAGALFVLPSLLLLIGLSWLYVVAGGQPMVAGVLAGIKPAVIAIVVAAGWRMATRSLRHPAAWALAAGAFVASVLAVPFPAIVLAGALAGLLSVRLLPGAFGTTVGSGPHAGSHGGSGRSPSAPTASSTRAQTTGEAPPVSAAHALIDDHTPPPAHTRAASGRLILTVLAGIALGLGVYAVLRSGLLAPGLGQTLSDMAAFFTKAALLTFGGAYAVLPYVVQGAVQQHGWLSSTQMLDGLALGETTPGPLIMVVAFVGFLGGWSADTAGANPLAWASLGACTATFFTFLPSFLFILAGGPLVERTRADLRVGAPLAGIAAVVVGVIAAMAVYFAREVLFPAPSHGFDPIAALLALAAGAALIAGRVSVVKVIAGCALAGLLLRLAGWH